MNTKEIIIKYLKDNGFSGLRNDEDSGFPQCNCDVENICDAGCDDVNMVMNCKPYIKTW